MIYSPSNSDSHRATARLLEAEAKLARDWADWVSGSQGIKSTSLMVLKVWRHKTMVDVTRILARIESGDPKAAEQLLPLVYGELRKLAAAKLGQEKSGQTLQATALVHDAYVRLVDQSPPQRWDNRRHFFAAAAEAMRRILIERARQKRSLKRGGDLMRVELADIEPAVLPLDCDDILGLDEVLQKLEAKHPRKAELVKLRFFAGLTTSQAAQALGVSLATAENDWAYARSWLRVAMTSDEPK